MNSRKELCLFHTSLQREPSPEQHNAGVQTDFTPRSPGPISSQFQHKADCEARPQSEDLDEFKCLARAWYLACKADPGKELWNIMHFFWLQLSKSKGIFYSTPNAFAANVPHPMAASNRHFSTTVTTPTVPSEADFFVCIVFSCQEGRSVKKKRSLFR